MNKDLGASANAEPGSRTSTEPCFTVSALTGFDLAREVCGECGDTDCLLDEATELCESCFDHLFGTVEGFRE